MTGGCLASAQTALPEIVVTAPSPIVHRPPARPATPAPAPGPVATAPELAPQPPTSAPSVDTFVPVTVVNAAEIARSTGATLGDVLFAQPGITATTFAPGAASRPVIRGLDNFRVRIQEAGLSSMDVSDLGEDHAVPIDPLAAQHIEVIRGPATLRFGSQAIGGVVDVSNNRIPDRIVPGVHGSLLSAFKSVDRSGEGGLLLDAGGQNVALHADTYGRVADDYAIPGGVQPNSAMRASGHALGGSYFFPGGYVGVAVSRYSSLYHVPGTDSAASNTRIDLDQTKVMSKGEYRPTSSIVDAVRFWLGASAYKHDEIGIGEDGTDGVQATFKNQQQEARIETQFMPWQTWVGPMTSAVGVQFGHLNLGTSGEAGTLLAPSTTRSAAAYLFNELALTNSLKLQTAGRAEVDTVAGTASIFPGDYTGGGVAPVEFDASRRFVPLSASVGLLQDLPWQMVGRLTAQYVQRAPRAPELFSKGSHDAPGTFEIGNPDLTKEAAQTVEVGLKRAVGRLRFDGSLYYTRFAGFIYKRLTGLKCDDDFDSCGTTGTELTQIVYSQSDAVFRGAELKAEYDVMPLQGGTLGVDGQYDIVRATLADGSNVPRMPPQRLGGGLWWRDAQWLARVGLLHAFAQNDIAANETPTPGYNLLKAELSHTSKLAANDLGARELTFGIVGDNLLDDEVRNSVSYRKDEVLLPGRSVKLYASVKF